MNMLSRRGFLAASAATLSTAALPRFAMAQNAISLSAATRVLDVNGRAATVFGLEGPSGQGLVLNPGQRFRASLTNRLDVPTLIHWHGQIPPNEQDGVPDLPQPMLQPDETRSYDYEPLPGTYWMHAHLPLQEMNLLAAPNSEYVSAEVLQVWEFGYKTAEDKKRDKRPERMSSWFCDGVTFEELDRQGVRAKVFQAEMPPVWTAYATTSYKKHGSLRSRVNTGGKRVWLFEERAVDLSDMATVNEWWGVLNQALRDGFGRSVLETLDCPPYLIAKNGLAKWQALEAWGRDKINSAKYAFLCYLLPSQEELKQITARW